MHMIMNNLDDRVAQFPHELVTYGGNGQVFSNWAQVSSLSCIVDVHRISVSAPNLTFLLIRFSVWFRFRCKKDSVVSVSAETEKLDSDVL